MDSTKNEIIEIEPVVSTTMRLVKYEDLNHHGTLFAGRSTEWFVESGFIAATRFLPANNVVCRKIHGMNFTKPVKPGEIVRFDSKIIYVGKSSVITHIKANVGNSETSFLSGFITFIHVDQTTKASAHNLKLKISTIEDEILNKEALELIK